VKNKMDYFATLLGSCCGILFCVEGIGGGLADMIGVICGK
jgi:hypothetical protein